MAAKNLTTLAVLIFLVVLSSTSNAADSPERLECSAAFQKSAGLGWAVTLQGKTPREASFRVDRIDGKIVVGKNRLGEPFGLHIDIEILPTTIAIFHTHPNAGIATPSAKDVTAPVPNYVLSRDGLFVTIPGTRTYKKVEPCSK